MSREVYARLAHDVGKYVARIARNAPADGPFPAALVPLRDPRLRESLAFENM